MPRKIDLKSLMKCRCGCGKEVEPKIRAHGKKSTSTFYNAECRKLFQSQVLEAYNRREQQEYDITPRTAFDKWLYRYRTGYNRPMVYGA